MSTKQESVSDAAFKIWLFSSDFNFASKDDWVTAATYKYCPLVVSPTVTNCCKELHLSLKTSTCTKTSLVSCENQSFFLLFWNVVTFIKSHCAFLCYFLQYDDVFLISLLGGCYQYLASMDQVSGCLKSKLLAKE